MFVIGFLTLILLIPLFMVQELIQERVQRQKSVVAEINDKWVDEVIIFEPVLKLPYRTFREKHRKYGKKFFSLGFTGLCISFNTHRNY